MRLSFVFEAIARNPPSVMIVVALVFGLVGAASNNPFLINMAIWCMIGGVLLQVLYLACRRGGF